MAYVIVDVETDGPCPHLYSMISLGAVLAADPSKSFYAQFKPVSDTWVPEALAVSGHSREETLDFPDPKEGMQGFADWLKDSCGTRKNRRGQEILDANFVSDNNGFDWQFVNYYFWRFLEDNPFGHSSTNMGSMYKGMVKDCFKNFKHLRKTKHTHHPVDDARGNAEALLEMKRMGLRIKL